MTLKWTDDDIVTAWRTGYDYAIGNPIAAAIDEVHAAAPLAPAEPTTEEQRVAARVALFEQCAAEYRQRHPYVEWPDATTVQPGTLTVEQVRRLHRSVFCKRELRWVDPTTEPGHGRSQCKTEVGDVAWAHKYANHPPIDWAEEL